MTGAELMVAGTILKGLAQYGANIQQSIQEAANASFYKEQELLNIASIERAVRSAERESGYKVGTMKTTYGASGLDVGAGSALTNIATALADGIADVAYTRRKGELDVKLARMRGAQAAATASTLSSAGYNAVQFGTTVLSNATAAEGFSNLLGYGKGA